MMLKRVKPEFDMARNRPENPTGAEPVKAPGVQFTNPGGSAMPAGGRSMPVMKAQ
jgi:hypothetical protein